MEDLVEFGPYKPPAEHGYDVKELEAVATNETAATASKEPRTLDGRDYLYQADPTGRRTGYGRKVGAMRAALRFAHVQPRNTSRSC